MGSSPMPQQTPKLPRYLEPIAAADAPAAVLRAVQSYLNAWPRERIESVQKVHGGWAPFDWNQRPLRVNGVRDLRRIRDEVHGHCMTLGEAGMTPTPELAELDTFFRVATEKTESLERAGAQARAPAMRVPELPSRQYAL